MSNEFSRKVKAIQVPAGHLAIFWLGQAGFVYKTPTDRVIYIDPYLSDCVHRLLHTERYGFKRIMPSLLQAEEVEADQIVCTHSHADHFDYDAIPILARKPNLHFTAAPDCRAEFEKLWVPAEKYTILSKGQTLDYGDFQLTGIYADHGDLAPLALGILLQVGSIRVWQVGDTAFRPDQWQDMFQNAIDVLIPPINGAYGNLDSIQAARLAQAAHARLVIPCHFWMFAEHGGDPAQFLEACKEIAPSTKPILMSQGEMVLVDEGHDQVL
jgi:L-ascorbate 6-phosphate lactonase